MATYHSSAGLCPLPAPITCCVSGRSQHLLAQIQFHQHPSLLDCPSLPLRWHCSHSPTRPTSARLKARTDLTITLLGSSRHDLCTSASTLPWPLQHGHFDQTILLAQAITHGTTIAISDGSYMPSHYPLLAAAAWVIHSGATPAAVSYGITQVHGQPLMVNSYRAKLQGMYSLILAINHICSLHQIALGSLLIGCDNQGVIHHLQQHPSYVSSSTKHADLV